MKKLTDNDQSESAVQNKPWGRWLLLPFAAVVAAIVACGIVALLVFWWLGGVPESGSFGDRYLMTTIPTFAFGFAFCSTAAVLAPSKNLLVAGIAVGVLCAACVCSLIYVETHPEEWTLLHTLLKNIFPVVGGLSALGMVKNGDLGQ